MNQYFGSARGFQVYGSSNDATTLLAIKIFSKENEDGNEDKLKPKLKWLHGCDLPGLCWLSGRFGDQTIDYVGCQSG